MNTNLEKRDFEFHMMRLIDQFGDKAFSETRLKMIYQEMRNLYVFQFKRIIDNFLMNSKFAPLPKDFIDLAAPYIQSNYQVVKNENKKIYSAFNDPIAKEKFVKAFNAILNGDDEKLKTVTTFIDKYSRSVCKRCGDTGVIFAKPKGQRWRADEAFNCNCEENKKTPIYRNWSAQIESEYQNNRTREAL